MLGTPVTDPKPRQAEPEEHDECYCFPPHNYVCANCHRAEIRSREHLVDEGERK